jgi:hypothetical protein
MNNFVSSLKIVIPIFVAITIVVIIFNLTQNEMVEEQVAELESPSEIKNILDKIEMEKLDNESSDNPYTPKEREWIQSGPFQIDRSEYVLGEKMFVNIMNLNKNDKGMMIFTKIINSTHVFEYKKMSFDGSKPQQNFYLSFDLFEKRGICTVDQLIGDWELRFVGVNGEYNILEFKIKNQIIPGMEERYEPVC